MSPARAGLVVNSTSAGTPAAAQRAGSLVQDLDRVELAVDHGVADGRGVGQMHRDLGVLDSPGAAGVLALHPHRGGALLQVPGLIDYQHPVAVAEVGDHELTQIITDPVGVPAPSAQQVLEPVGTVMVDVLGQGPAVLARQTSSRTLSHLVEQQRRHLGRRRRAGATPAGYRPLGNGCGAEHTTMV